MWTGQHLGTDANAAILEVVVARSRCLGTPWIVAADWQNPPEALQGSCWFRAVRSTIISPDSGTCRSKGRERVIDYFWADRRVVGALGRAFYAAQAGQCG